ncbi:MAG: hypothetical protein E7H57_06500, partial [Pantoea sp.]|nr:hypothetical protein [Pantoea sp.]
MTVDKLKNIFDKLKVSTEEVEKNYYENVMGKHSKKITSKGPLFNVRPYEYQRAGFETGKELTGIPKSKSEVYNYYFDSNGNVMLVETYGKKETIINREYFVYEDGTITSIYFNNKISIRNVTCSEITDDLIVKDINYGKFGESTSLYEYSDKVLLRINVSQKEHHQQDYSNYVVEFT